MTYQQEQEIAQREARIASFEDTIYSELAESVHEAIKFAEFEIDDPTYLIGHLFHYMARQEMDAVVNVLKSYVTNAAERQVEQRKW